MPSQSCIYKIDFLHFIHTWLGSSIKSNVFWNLLEADAIALSSYTRLGFLSSCMTLLPEMVRKDSTRIGHFLSYALPATTLPTPCLVCLFPFWFSMSSANTTCATF